MVPADSFWLSATEILTQSGGDPRVVGGYREACFDRIAAREAQVQAWSYLGIDPASNSGPLCERGPLQGIPIGIKDVFDTADMPTSYGYRGYAKRQPSRDATVVSLLRSAGAVVSGKTVTSEFAYSDPGATRNPHNLAHSPGGSSSGSAAAVADGMVPIAIGTQTGGSIIRPAAYCGVVGYKPTFGWIPRSGCFVVSESIDTPGVLARTIQDAALVVEVLTGRKLANAQPMVRDMTFGFDPTPYWEEVDPAIRDAIGATIENIRSVGIRVARVDIADEESLSTSQSTIVDYEASLALAHEWRVERDNLSPSVRGRLVRAGAITIEEYDAAITQVLEAKRESQRRLADFDAVITASSLDTAPVGYNMGRGVVNRMWSLLGVPCLHLPLGLDRRGLPIGMQLVAGPNRDSELLAACDWIAKHLQLLPLQRPVASAGD